MSNAYADLRERGWLQAQFVLADERIVYGLIHPESALDMILNAGAQTSVQMWVAEEDRPQVEQQQMRNVLVALM